MFFFDEIFMIFCTFLILISFEGRDIIHNLTSLLVLYLWQTFRDTFIQFSKLRAWEWFLLILLYSWIYLAISLIECFGLPDLSWVIDGVRWLCTVKWIKKEPDALKPTIGMLKSFSGPRFTPTPWDVYVEEKRRETAESEKAAQLEAKTAKTGDEKGVDSDINQAEEAAKKKGQDDDFLYHQINPSRFCSNDNNYMNYYADIREQQPSSADNTGNNNDSSSPGVSSHGSSSTVAASLSASVASDAAPSVVSCSSPVVACDASSSVASGSVTTVAREAAPSVVISSSQAVACDAAPSVVSGSTPVAQEPAVVEHTTSNECGGLSGSVYRTMSWNEYVAEKRRHTAVKREREARLRAEAKAAQKRENDNMSSTSSTSGTTSVMTSIQETSKPSTSAPRVADIATLVPCCSASVETTSPGSVAAADTTSASTMSSEKNVMSTATIVSVNSRVVPTTNVVESISSSTGIESVDSASRTSIPATVNSIASSAVSAQDVVVSIEESSGVVATANRSKTKPASVNSTASDVVSARSTAIPGTVNSIASTSVSAQDSVATTKESREVVTAMEKNSKIINSWLAIQSMNNSVIPAKETSTSSAEESAQNLDVPPNLSRDQALVVESVDEVLSNIASLDNSIAIIANIMNLDLNAMSSSVDCDIDFNEDDLSSSFFDDDNDVAMRKLARSTESNEPLLGFLSRVFQNDDMVKPSEPVETDEPIFGFLADIFEKDEEYLSRPVTITACSDNGVIDTSDSCYSDNEFDFDNDRDWSNTIITRAIDDLVLSSSCSSIATDDSMDIGVSHKTPNQLANAFWGNLLANIGRSFIVNHLKYGGALTEVTSPQETLIPVQLRGSESAIMADKFGESNFKAAASMVEYDTMYQNVEQYLISEQDCIITEPLVVDLDQEGTYGTIQEEDTYSFLDTSQFAVGAGFAAGLCIACCWRIIKS